MAEQRVTFSIGSVFNGKGFDAARKSVGEMGKSVKQAASASQQLAGAVSGMNNAASKAAGAMSGVFSVLASGSVVTMAVAGAVMVLNKRMGELQQAQADAASASAALQASLAKLKATKERLFDEALNKQVQDFTNRMKTLADQFERVTKNANELKAAASKLGATKDSGQLLGMQLDKQKAVNAALGDDKEVVAAQEDYKIQLKKNAIALERRKEAIERATQDLQDSFNRENNISDRIYLTRQEIAKLQEEKAALDSTDLEKMRKYDAKIQELQQQSQRLQVEYDDAVAKRTALKTKIATAEEEYAN